VSACVEGQYLEVFRGLIAKITQMFQLLAPGGRPSNLTVQSFFADDEGHVRRLCVPEKVLLALHAQIDDSACFHKAVVNANECERILVRLQKAGDKEWVENPD
jgi:hypothetical protein